MAKVFTNLLLSMLLTFGSVINYACSSTGGKKKPLEEQISRQLSKLSTHKAPGIHYIAVNKDSTIYSFCSGLADIKNKTPLHLHHTLSAFSMTKTVTAIAVLQLVERRQISLDDRLSRFVDHVYTDEICIKHLLNHTSGIPNPVPLKWVHPATGHNDFSEREALAKVLAENPALESAPGEKYSYSNIGYWLLGQVIEKASKEDYARFVRKNIFDPLLLTPDDIGFIITDSARHAQGYLAKYSMINLMKAFVTDKTVWGEYEGNWLHIQDVYVNGPSFGGAIGSARAFSRILQDLLAGQSVLLDKDSKKLLYSQQTIRSGKPINMTLGWHIGILKGVRYFYKEGGGAGFHCEMRIYPAQDLATVIMTNKTSFNSRKHLSDIDKILFEE